MKNAKPISLLICSILLIGLLLFACDNSKVKPSPVDNLTSLNFIEESNEFHVATPDNNLILTFIKDDFNEYHSEFNLKNTLFIEKLHFKCQKDEFFSNNIWIIKPVDIKFDKDFIINIKYAHEEFASQFNTTNLKIYKLKRDYPLREATIMKNCLYVLAILPYWIIVFKVMIKCMFSLKFQSLEDFFWVERCNN